MAAVEEMAQAMERFRPIAGTDEEMLFQYAMLSRQILSAVIDGDQARHGGILFGDFYSPPGERRKHSMAALFAEGGKPPPIVH